MTNAQRLYGGTDGQLADSIASGQVPVAVYGLGKMGLPLAASLAEPMGDVVGVDVDESVVDAVNAGQSHVPNEPGLNELVHEMVDSGSLRATTDSTRAATHASVHVVVVPTKLHDGATPDLDIVRAVIRQVATGLDAGDAVFIESTVPPGTCRDVVEPLLASESGLDTAEFGVAFCPERTSSGRALRDIQGAHPKVVGGTDPKATQTAQRFYQAVTDNEVIPVSDATTAEAVKVFEGVYRDVNIALANELGRVSERLGIDGREAIDVANTQPYCEIHDPGPGVGGHCIPFYPHFVMSTVDIDTPLIRTARSVNESMPGYTAGVVADLLEAAGKRVDESTVLLLGLTYRPGVKETTHTPTLPLARRLDQLGASVAAADPLVDEMALDENPATYLSLDMVESLAPDAVVIVTPHEEFETLDWAAFGDAVVLDARDGLDGVHGAYTLGDGRRTGGSDE